VRLCRGPVDDLHIAFIDIDQRCEHALPNAATRPAMKAIVDCRGRTVDRWTILPTTSDFQDVDDPAQHPPIIDPPSTWLVVRQQWGDRAPLFFTQPKFSSHDPSSVSSELESRLHKKFNDLIEF
jgi:hypothetical protein